MEFKAKADRNLILYRSKDGLGVRYDRDYVVAGQAATGRTALPMPAYERRPSCCSFSMIALDSSSS